jgi:hypothetical protein
MGQGAGSRVGTGRFRAMGHNWLQPCTQPRRDDRVDLLRVQLELVQRALPVGALRLDLLVQRREVVQAEVVGDLEFLIFWGHPDHPFERVEHGAARAAGREATTLVLHALVRTTSRSRCRDCVGLLSQQPGSGDSAVSVQQRAQASSHDGRHRRHSLVVVDVERQTPCVFCFVSPVGREGGEVRLYTPDEACNFYPLSFSLAPLLFFAAVSEDRCEGVCLLLCWMTARLLR